MKNLKLYGPFSWVVSNCLKVYFLPVSPQEFLVLI